MPAGKNTGGTTGKKTRNNVMDARLGNLTKI
jgi:hypothetical protein